MRIASEQDFFPYYSKANCYILISNSGEVNQLGFNKKSIKEGYREVKEGRAKLYVVWPGRWRSDIFLIDDLDKLLEGFKISKDEV